MLDAIGLLTIVALVTVAFCLLSGGFLLDSSIRDCDSFHTDCDLGQYSITCPIGGANGYIMHEQTIFIYQEK